LPWSPFTAPNTDTHVAARKQGTIDRRRRAAMRLIIAITGKSILCMATTHMNRT
jgi:hypothetical protein